MLGNTSPESLPPQAPSGLFRRQRASPNPWVLRGFLKTHEAAPRATMVFADPFCCPAAPPPTLLCFHVQPWASSQKAASPRSSAHFSSCRLLAETPGSVPATLKSFLAARALRARASESKLFLRFHHQGRPAFSQGGVLATSSSPVPLPPDGTHGGLGGAAIMISRPFLLSPARFQLP